MRRCLSFVSGAAAAVVLLALSAPVACAVPGEGVPPDDTSDAHAEFALDDAAASLWSPLDDEEGLEAEPGDLIHEFMREAAALRANPLDLNSAHAHELARVPGLDPADAKAIVEFRRARGRLNGVEDLEASPRFPPEFVRALRPYVVCREGPAPPAAAKDGPGPPGAGFTWSVRARTSCRLRPGDDWAVGAPRDLGRAASVFTRLRLSGGDAWRAGAAFERDAWETDLLDHTAFHVSWRAPEPGRGDHRLACVAGHVMVDWGQGLLLTGGRFADTSSFPRRRDRARGYDGAGETSSRTGVHVAAGRGAVDVDLLGTLTRFDATVDDEGRVSAIRTSGHHRTSGERDGRDALSERCAGARAFVSPTASLSFGLSALSLTYEPGLARGDPERQRFRFHGETLGASAVDVRCVFGRLTLGAEAATTSFGGRALVAAARVAAGRLSARFGFGHLSSRYWLPAGGGIPGVSGGTNGTSGWLGVEYAPVRGARLRAELLIVGRQWRSYTRELPDTRERATVGATARVAGLGTLDAELRVRFGSADGGTAAETTTRTRLSLRTDGRSPLSVTVRRSTTGSEGLELGSLAAVSVRWDVGAGDGSLLSVGATTVASVGSASPEVQYEPALPGEFALRTLNASGTRWYIRLKVGVSESLGLSARVSGGPERGEYALGVSLDAKG
ncbi:MAG: helix-hairpin-helix domain-containing protein [Candidatus Eisenbacteria bacterium]